MPHLDVHFSLARLLNFSPNAAWGALNKYAILMKYRPG